MKAIGRTMNNVAIKSASKYRIRNTIKLNLSNNHDLFKITCLCFHIWSSYNSLQHFSFFTNFNISWSYWLDTAFWTSNIIEPSIIENWTYLKIEHTVIEHIWKLNRVENWTIEKIFYQVVSDRRSQGWSIIMIEMNDRFLHGWMTKNDGMKLLYGNQNIVVVVQLIMIT